MSEIFMPLQPRAHEDPAAAGVVQANLEYVMALFEKGTTDGDTLVWDTITGRYQAKQAGGVESVLGLPLSDIYPGREIILQDSIASPTYNWHLRYNAASISPYKWECIGATPGFATATGDLRGMTNNTYVNTAGGPVFTLPAGVGGDFYIVISGCILIHAAGGDIDRANISYKIGAGAASDVWSVRAEMGLTDTEGGVTGMQGYRHTGIAAGAQIVAQDRQEGGAGHSVLGARTLSVTPIRVG